jgi:uncharacterized membrane protein
MINEKRRPAGAANPKSLAGDDPIVTPNVDNSHRHAPDFNVARLRPRDGELHVVRWIRSDGREVRHRYFRRRRDAERLCAWLEGLAMPCQIFSTTTRWTA